MRSLNTLSFSYQNPLAARFGEDFFKKVPTDAGVYFFLNEKREPLYIGKADCLRKRLRSYLAGKPGQTPEHILEMIELAHSIRWETYSSGEKALLREATLIRTMQPPFNIAGTWPATYLFCGIAVMGSENGLSKVEFRLTHMDDLGDNFETYGCFNHRGKTKAGYSALLRLFFAATCLRERFHLPARLCRTSPAYVYRAEIPSDWVNPLRVFLKGEDSSLLKLITKSLLERENVPAHLYAPLQRDLNAAKLFFEAGPEATRKLVRLKNKKHPLVAQEEMIQLLSKSVRQGLLRKTRIARRVPLRDRDAL